MGANLTDEIAKGLKAYGESRDYNYSDQFYEDLSWGGLRYYNGNRKRPPEIYTATVTSQADKNRIESIIANEKNSKGGKPCE